METIPTAEQFLKGCEHDGSYIPIDVVKKKMKAFAELHVEAALRRAYYNQGMSWTNSDNEETKIQLFIRNSYSLINIK